MEGLKLLPVSFQDCPGLGPVQQQRQNTAVVNAQLRGQAELVITLDTVQLAHEEASLIRRIISHDE